MIKLRGRHGDPQPRVQKVIDRVIAATPNPCVLEAGCGSMTRIALGNNCYLAGIDISERQLERNNTLSQKIHANLQTYRWDSTKFDIIVCWDVIEHLDDPCAAISNLVSALKPSGIIVLAFPNFWSLKGIVTKLTPFKVHAWFYYLLGDRRRIDELDQFPTPFRYAIAPQNLKKLMQNAGLEIVLDEIYEGPVQSHMRKRYRLADWGFGALAAISKILSFGTLDLGLSDCILIFRRPI